VNWLVGGIVVVEAVYGYPGIGLYMLDSAVFKDINAIEAGAMVMVALAVSEPEVAVSVAVVSAVTEVGAV
jgi:peptide/nickel transport system permease protein